MVDHVKHIPYVLLDVWHVLRLQVRYLCVHLHTHSTESDNSMRAATCGRSPEGIMSDDEERATSLRNGRGPALCELDSPHKLACFGEWTLPYNFRQL